MLVVGRFAPDGGTGRQAWEIAGGLAARGHAVRVVCSDGLDRSGVTVERTLPHGSGALGVWRRARFVRGLSGRGLVLTLIRAPGAVHRAGGGAHAAWMRARGGLPRPVDLAELAAEAEAVRGARFVVGNSAMACRDLRDQHGLSEDRVRLIRNGVDLDRFRPDSLARSDVRRALGVPEGGRVALFVGHGFRRKGLDVAARSFARVAEPRDRLVVLGRDARSTTRLASAGRVVGGRLIAVGTRPDPERWLAAADALLSPTRYDPSANTTLEAFAADLPVVTSGRDGGSEIAPEGAFVVADPDDVEGFAQALRRAWEDRGPVGRFRTVAERWPASRMAHAVEGLFQELVNG